MLIAGCCCAGLASSGTRISSKDKQFTALLGEQDASWMNPGTYLILIDPV
jgi:hypothetical protein